MRTRREGSRERPHTCPEQVLLGQINQQRPASYHGQAQAEHHRTGHSNRGKHSHRNPALPRPTPIPRAGDISGATLSVHAQRHPRGEDSVPQPCAYTQQGWARKGRAEDIILCWALQVRKLGSNLHTRRAGAIRRPAITIMKMPELPKTRRPFSCKLACPFISLQHPIWALVTKLLKSPSGHLPPGISHNP